MKILYVLKCVLFLFLLSSCDSGQDYTIDGHWHLFNENGTPYHFSTVDFTDTIGILNNVRHLDNYPYFVVRKDEKRIIQPMPEIYAEYDYSIINDTLALVNKNSQKTFFGVKKSKSNCDFSKDYFAGSMLEIDLPILNSDLNLEIRNSLRFSLYIGKAKEVYSEIYGDQTKIQSFSRIVEIEGLALENERFEIRLPENYRENTAMILFVDKQTNLESIKQLILAQEKLNNRPIYIAGLPKSNPKITNSKDLVFMKINSETQFNVNTSIEKWLEIQN